MATLTVAHHHHNHEPRRTGRRAMTFMTHEELLTVLKVARQRRTRDWCMLLVAYWHGLRTTEVCGLRLTDLKEGVLSVQRLKGSRRTVQPLYPHHGEPLLDEVKALREWLRVRPNDGSDALFTSQKGGALDRCQFFRIFQSVATAAGLSAGKRHPRVLKYSLASHLLAAHADVAVVSEILGHRSLNSTLQYVKAAADASDDDLARSLRHRGIARVQTTTQSTMAGVTV
jgi:type 1 fimbriae regulatory protein FimB